MKFSVSGEIFERYPDAVIGVIVARNLNNSGSSQEISGLLRREEDSIRNGFDLENLAQNPLISSWRKAYKLFGSDDRCSSEALVRRVLKGDMIPSISKAVDIYNYISLKYRTPAGGEDLDKIEGDVCLKFSAGGEEFTVLGGNATERLDAGEVVYCDGKEVLCRKWNWRESENTKLAERTRNAFLVIEALPPVGMETVRSALEEFGALLRDHCGAGTQAFILHAGNREIEF